MENSHYLCCGDVAAVVTIPGRPTADQWDALISAFRERAVSDDEERRWAHVWNLEMDARRSHAGVFWHEELAGAAGASYVMMPLEGCSDEALNACESHIRREGDVVKIQSVRPLHFIHDEAARMVARAMLPALPAVPRAGEKLHERSVRDRGGDRLFVGCYPTGLVYADRWVEVSGDYKSLGYLNYESLEFTWREGAPTAPVELLDEVISHAEGVRDRVGQSYAVAGNMSVILGERLVPPVPSVLQEKGRGRGR